MTIWNRKTAVWRAFALVTLLGSGASCLAFVESAKAQKTPCFWQRDPGSNYPNEGRYHCGPVAIAEGLMYLATVRGHNGLVGSSGRLGQMALINALAKRMSTDSAAGTKATNILNGLCVYADEHNYSFERLEVATWMGLSKRNQQYLVADKPNLRWLAAAANDPDTIVIASVGWYKKDGNGGYTRPSGHWVNVIGAGTRPLEFHIHNPAWEAKRQRKDTAITLKLVDKNFILTHPNGRKMSLAGHYECDGPGLSINKKVISAVLDGAIVFKLKKKDA